MSEQEKLQRESCGLQFKEVFRRLDAVEKFDRDLLEGKLDTFTQAITKFDVLFSSCVLPFVLASAFLQLHRCHRL